MYECADNLSNSRHRSGEKDTRQNTKRGAIEGQGGWAERVKERVKQGMDSVAGKARFYGRAVSHVNRLMEVSFQPCRKLRAGRRGRILAITKRPINKRAAYCASLG